MLNVASGRGWKLGGPYSLITHSVTDNQGPENGTMSQKAL
jgi:hypothetical protein